MQNVLLSILQSSSSLWKQSCLSPLCKVYSSFLTKYCSFWNPRSIAPRNQLSLFLLVPSSMNWIAHKIISTSLMGKVIILSERKKNYYLPKSTKKFFFEGQKIVFIFLINIILLFVISLNSFLTTHIFLKVKLIFLVEGKCHSPLSERKVFHSFRKVYFSLWKFYFLHWEPSSSTFVKIQLAINIPLQIFWTTGITLDSHLTSILRTVV